MESLIYIFALIGVVATLYFAYRVKGLYKAYLEYKKHCAARRKKAMDDDA